MLDHPLPTALAHWVLLRLADTLEGPLDDDRVYELTVVDPADHAPDRMIVRSSFLGDLDAPIGHHRPDALAIASRIWVPDPEARAVRATRPSEFVQRRPATVVSVVDDHGTGSVLLLDRRPSQPVPLRAAEAGGLLMPLVHRWCQYGDHRAA